MSGSPAIVLASASPRRVELLRRAGLEFEVRPSFVDEDVEPGWSPDEAARRLALRKARAVAAELPLPDPRTPTWVLGADTIVAVTLERDGEELQRMLGKPADASEAHEFLALLSGSRHRVVTGFAWVRAPAGPRSWARSAPT